MHKIEKDSRKRAQRGVAATKEPEISQQGHKGHEDKTVSTKFLQ
jgi:hypothetical protein